MDRVARRGPLARAPGALKGDTSEIVNDFVAVEGVLSQIIKKLKRGKIFGKKSRGPFGIFQHPFCRKTAKKIEGGTLWGKNFPEKKVSQCRKKLEWGTLWYGTVRGKTGKPFWFSSLDQIVQFGAIIFCRTFKNYFGQFVWIEKKEKPL